MNRWQLSFFASLVSMLALGLTVGLAQAQDDWRAGEPPGEQEVKLKQGYTGVRPGSGNNLPRVEELRDKPGTWVTWPGFLMMQDGTSRLFLQTTVPVAYAINEKNKRISLKLKKAKVHLRNNRNPLVTVHFNTPLNRAYLKKSRKSLDLIMELRKSVFPAISQTVDGDGYHYLFIDFPPGNYPSAVDKNQSFRRHGTETPQGETIEAAPEDLPPDQ